MALHIFAVPQFVAFYQLVAWVAKYRGVVLWVIFASNDGEDIDTTIGIDEGGTGDVTLVLPFVLLLQGAAI